ncbi:serine/threonine protein kinase [Actinoplanes sp. KI2]|uniref:serine/threonine-protein kinase n=1 Tax=Actinoplanes sp. KI2 TaxID=2983315 RepID=UPI0021D61218|nr:serine/threonine-protein kinase [Actinoplanes sp. KI2]MCU7728915.1 serine/threonine protein kinase [Actinoplanes sp. KI2]
MRLEENAGVERVAGRYRLIALLGAGGMGRVYRAHDELLDREVAVKCVRAPAVRDTVREARAAARLDHPHVIRIFDVVQADGRSWIIMEYVPSRSLHEVVSEGGPLTHRDAARIGLAVLEALEAAHAAGVVHRDVKPRNVLIAADGRVVLADFGLAAVGAEPAGPGEPILGSPSYVAPEQLRRGVSGEPGDLWSLGATLYYAVEGRPPFARPSVAESLSALLSGPPDPPQRPGPLHSIITPLLTPDPDRRPSATDVRTALRDAMTRAIGVYAVPAPRRPAGGAVRFRPAATRVPIRPDVHEVRAAGPGFLGRWCRLLVPGLS